MDAPLSAGRGKPDPSEKKPRGGGARRRAQRRAAAAAAAPKYARRRQVCNTPPMPSQCLLQLRPGGPHLRRVPEPEGRGRREEVLQLWSGGSDISADCPQPRRRSASPARPARVTAGLQRA